MLSTNAEFMLCTSAGTTCFLTEWDPLSWTSETVYNYECNDIVGQVEDFIKTILYVLCSCNHSGETDEANCRYGCCRSDLGTICVASRISTKLIICIHIVFHVSHNVYKPHRLFWECCQDKSGWKSRVAKRTVLGDEASCWGTFA